MTTKQQTLLCYAIVGVLVVALDIVTKAVIEQYLLGHSAVDLLPFLKLVLVYNRGAAFGFLSEASGWQLVVFVVVGLIVSLGIVIRLWRAAGTQKWFEFALVLILSGTIGNLFDRMRIGYVVDFLSIYYRSWEFPAFNIADIAIFFGALMLILELVGISPHSRTRE